MGLFNKKRSISRAQLGKTLRGSRGIPGTGGKKYTQGEIQKLEREVFSPKYGSEISKNDYRRALRGLESEKSRTEDRVGKANLDKKIRYLKRLERR